MTDTVLTVEDAAARLPELVERVSSRREPAVILTSGKLMARLVPCPPKSERTSDLIAFLTRWRSEHPEPDDGWAAAIEETRQSRVAQVGTTCVRSTGTASVQTRNDAVFELVADPEVSCACGTQLLRSCATRG